MKMLRVVLSAIAGNALEIYDMVVYGLFASVIAQHFFPSEEQLTGLTNIFALFFIGYLARPLGAIVFGRIGDRYGRKPALLMSIWLMALSTCGIGLIPDYDTIGGPILLLLNLRILQGFSCGGELIGSIIFLVEHAPRERRGFYGSLGGAGYSLGLLMASLLMWLINTSFDQVEMMRWAWRLPFLLAALGGIVGWLARRAVPETDLFLETYKLPQSYFTTRRDIAKQLRPTIMIVGIQLFAAVLGYLIYVFMVIYMSNILHYTIRQALGIHFVSVILLVLLKPCMGMLSDRIGRRPLMFFALIGTMLWAWPYFWLLQQHSLALALLAQLVMTLFAAAYIAIDIVTMVEMVPLQWRFTVVSIAYALAVSLFGGITPFMATLLIKAMNSYYSLALYLVVAALISLFAVYKIRETKPTK